MTEPGHPASDSARYRVFIPPAWRALAALSYLSVFFAFGLVLPAAVYVLYRRSAFLRLHALTAGLLHAIGLAIEVLLRLPAWLFLIEIEGQTLLEPDQILGSLLKEQLFALTVIVLMSTLALATLLASAGRDQPLRPRPGRVRSESVLSMALLASVATPLLLYWAPLWGSLAPDGTPGGVLDLDVRRFENPYLLVPGHAILLWCATLALVAARGQTFPFRSARRLFVRFERDQRKTGVARRAPALLRARLLPGWGQFYAGERVAGLFTLSAFLLVLLFLWLSVGLNYGRLVEGMPGLNENFAWYFLDQLGLRTHVLPDERFMEVFGNWVALGLLSGLLVLAFFYSDYATRQLFAGPGRRRWLQTVSHSLILHMFPVTLLLLMPVSLLSPFPPPGGAPTEPQLTLVSSYDPGDQEPELNGSVSSGENGQDENTAAPRERARPAAPQGPGVRAEPSESAVAEESQEEPEDQETLGLSQEEEHSERAGERRQQTYSNYLSVKIRAPEDELNYWESLPVPYSAVFEYRITADGVVYGVRIVEGSGHPEADELTVQLIETMGVVLPPPGGTSVVVTELFWNTLPGDPSLPTPLQRDLSTAFDGRIIRPL